jgi:release factor glutamine methyltransferase
VADRPSDRPTWQNLLAEGQRRLNDRSDARRIAAQASGWDDDELVQYLAERSTPLTHARWAAMVERRAAGEPLQYVLGRWGFRTLDLLVDRRVLIPRPETETVVEIALAEADRLGARVAVDLGTGSGAIALSLAVERTGLEVWATDVSTDALDVTRANLAGIGRAGARVRLEVGSWYEALPAALVGQVDLIVSNPPYVAGSDVLPDEVRLWEPDGALVAGPTGVEAVTEILRAAPRWLSRPGSVVVEIGETQAAAVRDSALEAGFDDVDVRPDLAGRDRVVVARLSSPDDAS